MELEEINRKINLACGWKPYIKAGVEWWISPKPDYHRYMGTLNYYENLNAMHHAEKTLTEKQWDKFELELGWLTGDRGFCKINATAPQRAEAFLKTIGQWQESE